MKSSRLCRQSAQQSIGAGNGLEVEMEGNLGAPPLTGGSVSLANGLDRLSGALRARAVLPNSDSYDTARRVWNGFVDKRPAVILPCTSGQDVIEAVALARTTGLLVAVRGGGHNIAGASVCDGGIVIDLSPMKTVTVDPGLRIVRAEPGLTLGEFDTATQAYGLATTMGVNSDTGIAGLTLGGGFGRLGRKFGLACDNLLSAEIVLADGRTVTASASEHSELFWGIRGGGGNFGVVINFTYRLHPVGPEILGGLVLHDFRDARETLRFYRDFSAAAPDEVSADVVFLSTPEGQRIVAISACYVGSVDEGERALLPLRTFGSPMQDLIAPVPYTALQASADPLFHRGRRYYWKAQFLSQITDAAIDALIDSHSGAESASSLIVLQQVGGAIGRIDQTATAYGNRDASYDCFPVAVWDNAAEDERHIAWAREFWARMRPFATGGVYANNLGDEGEDRIRAAYGANYARLSRLKANYDPNNLFRLNQNIQPVRAS
jgi:FAD/FMN-containing dehydrogenase